MWTDSLIRIEAPEPSITLLVVTDCDVSERFLRSPDVIDDVFCSV